MKHITLILISCMVIMPLMAQPPLPPPGQRWIVNEKYSDEFNGTSLDKSKWFDYHPTWKGRPPGLFLPSQVSVQNGYLKLQGAKMDKDTIIYNWDGTTSSFNVKAGIVVSIAQEASFGYYECRFKAAANTMSSTFWFSTRGSFPGPETCNDKYGLEWDVQECIGKEGSFNGTWFAKGMHSNSHFWYTGCDGEKLDLRAESVEFEDEKLASEDFDVYGGWWHDESRATYYYNNSEGRTHRFVTSIKDKPFDRTMGMNLAHETYPFPWIRLPTDEELADTSANYVLYDWVRAYTLSHVDLPVPPEGGSPVSNGDFETGDLRGWKASGEQSAAVVSDHVFAGKYSLHISGSTSVSQTFRLKPITNYQIYCFAKVLSGSLEFGLAEGANGSLTCNDEFYTMKKLNFTTDGSGRVEVYISAASEGDEAYVDNIVAVEVADPQAEPEETVMFDEKIYFTDTLAARTSRGKLAFRLAHMANADREIHLELRYPDGTLAGEQGYEALGGFGHKEYILILDSVPATGPGYRIVADIRTIGGSEADTFQTCSQVFELIPPVSLEVMVRDIRDESPIENAEVRIAGSVSTSDSEGKAHFGDIDQGTVHVSVSKDGFETLDVSLEGITGDSVVVVHLSPETYQLTLLLTNDYTGEVIRDAEVSIGDEILSSNYQGEVKGMLFKGSFSASIHHPRYADTVINFTLSGDTLFSVALRQSLADAKFVVKLNGSSLHNAAIHMDDRSVSTSTVGIAGFSDLKTDTTYTYIVNYEQQILEEDKLLLKTDSTLRKFYTIDLILTFQDNIPRIYPNPANQKLNISGLTYPLDYQIIDIAGKRVDEGIIGSGTVINTEAIPSGIYYLKAGEEGILKFSILR